MGRWLAVGLLLLTTRAAVSAEPFQPFLDGLRDRGYFDIAIQYLDEVEQRTNVPPEVREVIPYERAQTLLLGAASLRSLEERRAQLDRAEQSLDRFLAESPNHALAGRAGTARAELQFERAVVDIWDADAATETSQADELRERARAALEVARQTLAPALAQHEKDWKSFPTFIPEEDRKQKAAQAEAKERFVKSQLDAARIDYWEAQSYPRETEERTKAIEKAAAAFEHIAQQYRGDIAGEYATLWQGKCVEELGDLRKSLAIYRDVINRNEGNDPTVAPLKDLAVQFELEGLSQTKVAEDTALIIEKAERWLKDYKDRATTEAGVAIRWELSQALEVQSADRSRTEAQQRGDKAAALEHAREVARYGSQHKADASRMVQRLMLALDRKGGNARDFATAYAMASALVEEATRLGDAYRAAQSKGDRRELADLTRSLKSTGAEMASLFTQALKLRRDNTEPEKVALARLQLAYAFFLQGKYLDCAALADYQMRRDGAAFPDIARRAATLAMSALDAAVNQSSTPDVQAEIAWQEQLGAAVITKWPETDTAQEAKAILAKAAWNRSESLAAAEWWSKIPPNTPQYATAQISAGQAYWKMYIESSLAPESKRPDAAKIREWKELAIKRLEEGVAQREAKLSRNAATPDDLVIGKLTLAQVRNVDGMFQSKDGKRGAIELLTEKPHDVISAVAAPSNGERPSDSTKARSAKVASVAYQQLLRSYIGVKDLDAARDARQELESLAGASNPQALTAVYVEFGRELQQELERLVATGEQDRADATRKGFEEFLTDIAKRTDGQSFSSMLWIAETFAGLAQGTKDPEAARAGFGRSAEIYSTMLSRADEPGFLPSPEYRQVVQLRLAANQRRQGDYQTAQQSLTGILEKSPNAPDVQAEAALLHQEWGMTTGSDEGRKLLQTAISGQRTSPMLWGWSGTIQRLQREAASRGNDSLKSLLVDARYGLAKSEFEFARLLGTDASQRDRHLDLARHAIFSFVRSSPNATDTDYARFNVLYGQILEESGQPIVALPRDVSTIREEPAVAASKNTPTAAASADKGAGKAATPKSRTPWVLIISLVAAGAAAAGGLIFYSLRQSAMKRQRLMELARGSAYRSPSST